jgi:hypothetical protein
MGKVPVTAKAADGLADARASLCELARPCLAERSIPPPLLDRRPQDVGVTSVRS